MAASNHGDRKPCRAVSDMETGRGVQIARRFRHFQNWYDVEGISDQIMVRQHHALGLSGRAARIEYAGHVVAVARHFIPHPTARPEIFESDHASGSRPVAKVDKVPNAANQGLERSKDGQKFIVDE